jgi:thiamine-phosphate pyrophosphorylase
VNLPAPPILVITDRQQCSEHLETRAASLFQAGCRFLSLREKDMAREERRALLEKLVAVGKSFGAKVGVHDDLAAAGSCGSALHLPANGDLAAARRLLGPGATIGQSCHNRAEIAAAMAGGADYVTVGPVFASASKPDYALLTDVGSAIAGFAIPILALGGIATGTLPSLPVGFAGVAVMGQAMTAPDPSAWFTELKTAWRASRRA